MAWQWPNKGLTLALLWVSDLTTLSLGSLTWKWGAYAHPAGLLGRVDAPTVGRAILTPHPDQGNTPPREAALGMRTDPACTVLGRAHPTEAVPHV